MTIPTRYIDDSNRMYIVASITDYLLRLMRMAYELG